MTLLEPWIMIRLVAGGVATLLFAYAAMVAARVLQYAHVRTATEGRLLVERQFELAATLVRVGAVTQLFSVVVSIVAADRLSTSIRGAMCGYGVVAQNRWGWLSMLTACLTGLASGIVLQLLAFDRRVRGLDLLGPLAILCIVLAPAVALDFGLTLAWLMPVDLTAVASCCSATLDDARREGTLFWQGPRVVSALGAAAGIPLTIAMALAALRRPARAVVGLSGLMTLVMLPCALGAAVLEVAPHVYEVPEHLCPFCLFKADAYFIGYPLFGALFLAATSGLGAAAAAMLATGERVREAFPEFARSRMSRQALAWALAFIVGVAPVLRYATTAPGASLFR